MPGWLQAFAKANPITVIVDALRALCLGVPAARPVTEALAWLAGILAVTVLAASPATGTCAAQEHRCRGIAPRPCGVGVAAGRVMRDGTLSSAPDQRISPARMTWTRFSAPTGGRQPGNVYLREADVLPAIDKWLSAIFAPHRLAQTIREMQAAQPPAATGPAEPDEDTRAVIADCDARLARYQATLDAGADPQAVAEWTRQVKAERAAALARDASQPVRQLTEDDIDALITDLGNLRDVSAPPGPPRRQPSTTSSTSRSPSSPEKRKSGPKSPSARRSMQSMRSNVGIRVVSEGGLEPPCP